MKENRKAYEEILSDAASHKYTFYYKSGFEHSLDLAKIVGTKLPKMVAVFVSAWAVAQIFLLDDKTELQKAILPSLLFSAALILYESLKQYWSSVPELLKNEPKKVQRIFFQKKVGWQYELTSALLQARLLEKEMSLVRIKQNADFVLPRILSDSDLIEFMKFQPLKVLRLSDSIKACCVHYLPNAVKNIKDGTDLELKVLLREIDNLADLYQYAVEHERSIYSIEPSEEYRVLIGYMRGWTDTLRDGIDQLVEIFERLSRFRRRDIKKQGTEPIKFEIVFESPKNTDNFNRELDRLTQTMT